MKQARYTAPLPFEASPGHCFPPYATNDDSIQLKQSTPNSKEETGHYEDAQSDVKDSALTDAVIEESLNWLRERPQSDPLIRTDFGCSAELPLELGDSSSSDREASTVQHYDSTGATKKHEIPTLRLHNVVVGSSPTRHQAPPPSAQKGPNDSASEAD